ncbi:hypothetical protein ACWD5F_28035 [Streptomyces sp. NPDC002499]
MKSVAHWASGVAIHAVSVAYSIASRRTSNGTRETGAPAETFVISGRRETGQFSEWIGDDVRHLDNLRSDVEVVRGITVARTVERQFQVVTEKSSVIEGTLKASGTLVGVSTEIESRVERAHADSISKSLMLTHSVEEYVEYVVNPRSEITVTLQWKRLWQRGEYTLDGCFGTVLAVPYQESIGLSFDVAVSGS